MNFGNLINKKILKKSLPFYLPICLGVISKLNNIALFVIPLQAINSIIKQRLSSRIKETFEIFNFPIPTNNNLFIFFFTLILLTLLILIFTEIFKKILILRIKKKIFSTNKIKVINKESINYYTKKFETVNYYIETTENIIFCFFLVLIIILWTANCSYYFVWRDLILFNSK